MLNEKELRIESKALDYAKKNRTRIARQLTDKTIFPADETPVSVFMAGSPGAGKTEFSVSLINQLESDKKTRILRLDPDDLRDKFEDYNGSNSYLFQKAVSLLVERTIDHAYKNHQSFLLDGTLASYSVAEKNISRAITRDRTILILFVYQRPELAWEFVQAREKVEGRRIQPEHFIMQYFGSQNVIKQLKAKFDNKIRVDVILKDTDGSTKNHYTDVDTIDNHIDNQLTKEQIEKMIRVGN